jgi:hypothetical protein
VTNPCFKLAALAAVSLLAACASKPVPGVALEAAYGDIHRSGARDMVDLLRDGMAHKQIYGMTDPYYPVRVPEEIMPVWVPTYIDPRTGRQIAGHWEYSVIRAARWAD